MFYVGLWQAWATSVAVSPLGRSEVQARSKHNKNEEDLGISNLRPVDGEVARKLLVVVGVDRIAADEVSTLEGPE